MLFLDNVEDDVPPLRVPLALVHLHRLEKLDVKPVGMPMRLSPKSYVSLLLQCILWERPTGVLLVGKQHLLELELSLGGKLDLVVLEVGELDGHEEAILALGPLDLREQSKKA